MADSTMIYRSTKIGLDTILEHDKYKNIVRKTNIVCTLGPACTSKDMLGKLIASGMNIARFNFSHGTHESHAEVLHRLRAVQSAHNSNTALMLDTKGPEIRTAMLRGGTNITLVKGQAVIIEAVGDKYSEFEGYKTESETRIGLSYAKLCSSVAPGQKILLADGTISIEVRQILSDTELEGTVLNTKPLGQRKNCNLPGVHVDLPVLMDKDIDDLQNFGCKHNMDFVVRSFMLQKLKLLKIHACFDNTAARCAVFIAAGKADGSVAVRRATCRTLLDSWCLTLSMVRAGSQLRAVQGRC